MSNTWSQDGYIQALRYAAMAHNGQLWPGTELPYLTHLSMVAMEVMAAISNEGAERPDLGIQCALLHDIIEDQDCTTEQLGEIFGAGVAAGVAALTKNRQLPKHEQMTDSLARIREQPREVWMVKLADRIANLQPAPAHWSLEKKRAYREQATEILASLGEASDLLALRLRQKIDQYSVS